MTSLPITIGNVIHLDVKTNQCTCTRAWCGGAAMIDDKCPEHGVDSSPILPIHSHRRTRKRSVYKGRGV